jgi:hypothetical protein
MLDLRHASLANGGRAFQYALRLMADLRAFATAAAKRYPQVQLRMAWNEPNAPNFLQPQSVRRSGRWIFVSPETYARICTPSSTASTPPATATGSPAVLSTRAGSCPPTAAATPSLRCSSFSE